MQSRQIAVRLPEDVLTWLDREVAEGRYASRAAGIAKLIRAAERKRALDQDLLRMMKVEPDDDELARLDWMRTRGFPDVEALAAAPSDEALEHDQDQQPESDRQHRQPLPRRMKSRA